VAEAWVTYAGGKVGRRTTNTALMEAATAP